MARVRVIVVWIAAGKQAVLAEDDKRAVPSADYMPAVVADKQAVPSADDK